VFADDQIGLSISLTVYIEAKSRVHKPKGFEQHRPFETFPSKLVKGRGRYSTRQYILEAQPKHTRLKSSCKEG